MSSISPPKQFNVSSVKRRRQSVAEMAAEAEKKIAENRQENSLSPHQQTSITNNNENIINATGPIKAKTSIFDLDSNLAHLRDKAIEMQTRKDEVEPDTEKLRTDELPKELRRELIEAPEERAHQGHRSLWRSPIIISADPSNVDNNNKNNTAIITSSSPQATAISGDVSRTVHIHHPPSTTTNNHNNNHDHHPQFHSSPSPLRYNNQNVKLLLSPALEQQHRHALDRYSLAELSRGGNDNNNNHNNNHHQPFPVRGGGNQAIVSAFFESPNAIREKRCGDRSIDEVLNEENYRVTDAARRIELAEKLIPEAQRQRREINEKCYADMVSAVGGILNRKKKKKILRESESKADAYLRKQKRVLLGKSDNDEDSTSSDDESTASGGRSIRRRRNKTNNSSSDDDDDDDSGSSIDFGDDSDGGKNRNNKKSKKPKKISTKNKKKKRKYESSLQQILDIVDSVLYDDAGKSTRADKPHTSNDENNIFSNSIMGDELFDESFVASEDDEFFTDGGDLDSDAGDSAFNSGDDNNNLKISKSGSMRLKAAGDAIRAAKRVSRGKKRRESLHGKNQIVDEDAERLERQRQLALRAKMEKERLAKMRAQLQAQRDAMSDEKKAAAKSSWFKKAIQASPTGSINRTSIHPLRSGTMSPGSLAKMMDVEFADDDNDRDTNDDDERSARHGISPTPDRPGTSAADNLVVSKKPGGAIEGFATVNSDGESSNDEETEEERKTRLELAERAANAAKSIFKKGETEQEAISLLGARRKSMLMLSDDPSDAANSEFVVDDDGGSWKLVGGASVSSRFVNNNNNNNAKTSLLEMRQIENCPSGIFLIQERPSRQEPLVELYIGNRAEDSQWLMIDYSKVVDTLDVLPDPVVALLGDEKHLCCSAPGTKVHVATIRRIDGNAASEISVMKNNKLDILPVTTQEALLLKATMHRLAAANKIAAARSGRSGMDDVFDEDGNTVLMSASPTDAALEKSKNQQQVNIGTDVISRFLRQRSADRRKEEARNAKRSEKANKNMNNFSNNNNDKSAEALRVMDAELQAVMNDALTNSQVDANSLLAALEKMRARQDKEGKEKERKNGLVSFADKVISGNKKKGAGEEVTKPLAKKSGGGLKQNNTTTTGAHDDDDELDEATKALLKSVQKLQKEKKDKKEQEKTEKERLAKEEKERERAKQITEQQLKELAAMKRKMEEDHKLSMFGPTITDPHATAEYINEHGLFGENDKNNNNTGKTKKGGGGGGGNKSGKGGGAGKTKNKLGKSTKKQDAAEVDALLSQSTKNKTNASASFKNNNNGGGSASFNASSKKPLTEQELKNQMLLQQLNDDVSSTPFVRPKLTRDEIAEADRERREYQLEQQRAGTAGSSSRSSVMHAAPAYTAEEKAEIERKQQEAKNQSLNNAQHRGSVLIHGDEDDEAYYSDPSSPNRTLNGRSASDLVGGSGSGRRRKGDQDDQGEKSTNNEGDDLTWGGNAGRTSRTPQGKNLSRPSSNNNKDPLDLDASINSVKNNNNNNNNNNNVNESSSGKFSLNQQSTKNNNASAVFGNNNNNSKSGSGFGNSKTERDIFGGQKQSTYQNSTQGSSFGTAVKGGPSFGKAFSGSSASSSHQHAAAASSLRSSIKIKNEKDNKNNSSSSAKPSGKLAASNKNIEGNEEAFRNGVLPGLTNEETNILQQYENSNNNNSSTNNNNTSSLEASERAKQEQQNLLKQSIADRILGPEGSPTKSFGLDGNNNEISVDDGDDETSSPNPTTNLSQNNGVGLSPLLSDGSVGRQDYSIRVKNNNGSSPRGNSNNDAYASSGILFGNSVPPDFFQNPLLSDRILTEAFEKVLQVAREAEEKKAEDEEKNKGLAMSVVDRDLSRSRSHLSPGGDGSPYRSASSALRELMGESMFRKARDAMYVPKTRGVDETEEDVRKAYQGRVRASILNADVFKDKTSDGGENDGENVDENGRPSTAVQIHDLVRDHVQLTFNLRQQLAELAKMLRASRNEAEIAALRKAILTTAWQYQHGREINLRKLIVLLERKTNHRKWLPFLVNENVYADIPGFDDSNIIPHSGRMYGGWRLPKDRIITGSMHTMMVLAANNDIIDVPSIPATASFEIQGLAPGSRRMTLSPKPPGLAQTARRPNTSSDEAHRDNNNNNTNNMNPRSSRMAAIAAAREGKGCRFYGVAHLSAEAEARMTKEKEEITIMQQQEAAKTKTEEKHRTFASSLPVIPSFLTKSKQDPTLTLAAFKK